MAKNRAAALLVVFWGMSAGINLCVAFPTPLPTTIANFYMHGTQPNGLVEGNEISVAQFDCANCHQSGSPTTPSAQIYAEWSGSLMAHSARDPLFYACLDIAEADAPGSGDTCIRCHSPKAWLEGRSTPTNGSAITKDDRDGITCHVCHRMVDPFDTSGEAPPVDPMILKDLGSDVPIQSVDRGMPGAAGNNGNGNYVIDPRDRRRGPFPLTEDGAPEPPGVQCFDFHWGSTFGKCLDEFEQEDGCPTYESPVHRESELCATCHDVSFPHFSYNLAGTDLVFNGGGSSHPDGNKYNMAAEQRTYSEWLKSDFAVGNGVDMDGRFGAVGQEFVSDCQDCHMAAHQNAKGCAFSFAGRNDIPKHGFVGAANWVLDAIALHYGPDGPFPGFPPPDKEGPDLSPFVVTQMAAAKTANTDMLERSADIEASLDDSQTPGIDQLKIRVINQTGHKLPTGYIDGRRMWLTVEYFDCTSNIVPIAVRGGYNETTAVLDSASTKVYQAKVGPDTVVGPIVGLPAEPSHHAIFGNKMYFDNRIPPRGFTNSKFDAIQASPVAYSYADGQYWDDTYFDVPPFAVGAKVVLYYQSTSKDYIEFLKNENPDFGVDPTNRGELAYALWNATGKSAPIMVDSLGSPSLFSTDLKGDLTGDRQVLVDDIPLFIEVLLGQNTDPRLICAADMNSSSIANGADIQLFVDSLLSP